MPSLIALAMVEEYQCPGCVNGIDPSTCPAFEWEQIGPKSGRCKGHCAGTIIAGLGHINLGLPKGFNRVVKPRDAEDFTNIRLFEDAADYRTVTNRFNVAVWAMEADGYLFVRIYSPRIDRTFVDVVKGGTLALVPDAIDVGKFINDID